MLELFLRANFLINSSEHDIMLARIGVSKIDVFSTFSNVKLNGILMMLLC